MALLTLVSYATFKPGFSLGHLTKLQNKKKHSNSSQSCKFKRLKVRPDNCLPCYSFIKIFSNLFISYCTAVLICITIFFCIFFCFSKLIFAPPCFRLRYTAAPYSRGKEKQTTPKRKELQRVLLTACPRAEGSKNHAMSKETRN